jgi:hypothetical protein
MIKTRIDGLPEEMREALEGLFQTKQDLKFMHPLAQGMELTSRFARARERATVGVGDLCIEKTGLSSTVVDRQIIVYVLWAKFDHTNPSHTAIADCWAQQDLILPPDYDCIVAYIAPSGNLYYRPHVASHLRSIGESELKEISATT